MAFRTVVLTKHCKCSCKNDYLVIQNDDIQMIHLSEIETVLFESVSISVTCVLLSELIKRKIAVFFCDEKHIPYSQLIPFSVHYLSSSKFSNQIAWTEEAKAVVWKNIVKEKIRQQRNVLVRHGLTDEAAMLEAYSIEVVDDDATNREGLAAKVYFNALFGKGFNRKSSESDLNAALDYGYSVLLALTAKIVVMNGYNAGLGIHHGGIFNPYNLACDVMECFRPIVDEIVIDNFQVCLDNSLKSKFWNLGNHELIVKKKICYLNNVLNTYARHVFKCIEESRDEELYSYELI